MNFLFAGSILSGLNAKKKSLPAFNPVDSSIGKTNSAVVPGYVVDSRIINCPFCKLSFISFVAETMYETSGSLDFLNGVGTQMITTSNFDIALKFVVAESFFVSTNCLISFVSISPI